MTTPSWIRTNRWWLLTLPVALLAMGAASSYHLKTFWYENGLHHVIGKAEPGKFVAVVDPYEDTEGKTAHRFKVKLTGISRLESVPQSYGDPLTPPKGTVAYQVHLDFEASPRMALKYCQVALVDDHRNRYGGESPDPLGQINLCVPEGHEGPNEAVVKGQKRGEQDAGAERPPTWSVSPVVLVAKGVKITQVWLWYSIPNYVVLPVPH